MNQVIREARFPFAVILGGAVSLVLFLFMQQLIVTNYSVHKAGPVLNNISMVQLHKQPQVITKPDHPPQPPTITRHPTLIHNSVMTNTQIERPTLSLAPTPGPGVPWVNGNHTNGSFATVHGSTPLRIKMRVRPLYPPVAARQGIEGSVKTCFTVTAGGMVADPHVVGASSPSARRMFGQAALKTIRQWTFFPRTVKGEAVATPNVCQNINFRLH